MLTRRGWQDLNRAWRKTNRSRPVDYTSCQIIAVTSRPIRYIRKTPAAIGPWRLIGTVFSLGLALPAFAYDDRYEIEERAGHARQAVTPQAPGRNGNTIAIKGIEPAFIYADLKASNLRGIELQEIQLQKTDLRGAELQGSYLVGAHLENADLSKADLRKAHLIEANLSSANLDDANLSNADLTGAKLAEASLIGTDLSEAHLGGVDFSGADLTEANLSNAHLTVTNLTRANLRGADLGGAKLYESDLSKANLIGVKGLEQSQLDEACGDQDTLLPEGLTIPICSEI